MTEIVSDDWSKAKDHYRIVSEAAKKLEYDSIIAEFEELTLEEKVDKLIESYARIRVYGPKG